MEIENTTFGTITIDGKTYEHDVLIYLSGEEEEALEEVLRDLTRALERGSEVCLRESNQLIIGSGQMGNVRLSPEAEAYFEKKDCKVLLQPTPDAIQVFNKSHAKKIGLFHVTC